MKYCIKLVKVHKVLKLDQPPWFKKYTGLNTKKRHAKDFLSSFSAFGKSMEILKKKLDVKLVKNDPGHKNF